MVKEVRHRYHFDGSCLPYSTITNFHSSVTLLNYNSEDSSCFDGISHGCSHSASTNCCSFHSYCCCDAVSVEASIASATVDCCCLLGSYSYYTQNAFGKAAATNYHSNCSTLGCFSTDCCCFGFGTMTNFDSKQASTDCIEIGCFVAYYWAYSSVNFAVNSTNHCYQMTTGYFNWYSD